MFEKNMRLAYLLDFYVDTLAPHDASVMRAYYEDDLSLAEIAEGVGISRQGVRHVIKKCEEQILFLEEKLGLAKRHGELTDAVGVLEELSPTLTDDGAREKIERVVAILLNKGV